MKSNIKYKLYYYSYIIIYSFFLTYVLVYVFFLKTISIYYTYLMILVTGILIGYMIADKAHRYVNNNKKNE
jgi:hypothetical protein